MIVLAQILGWIGAALTLAAYGLLTARLLTARGRIYQSLNILGGLGLLVNTAVLAVWPSALVNVVWIVIGLAGLVQARRSSRGLHEPEPSSGISGSHDDQV